MRASLWIAVASLVAVSSVGCGGGKRDAAAAVATTGALVGSVLEVDGAVTATRGGATRPLAVGDRVHDDDVIATGTGRVAIQLDRNQVVWRLGPRLSQQVAQSSAWSAPAAVANTVATTDEHSAAAGRHAEREAADTAASAVDPRATGAAAPAAAAPAAAAPLAQAPAAATAAPRSATMREENDRAIAPAQVEPAPPPPPPIAADVEVVGGEPPRDDAPVPRGGVAPEAPKLDDAVATKVETSLRAAAPGDGSVESSRAAKMAVPNNEIQAAPPPSGGDVGLPSVGSTLTVGTIRASGGVSTAAATTRVRARQRQLAACGKAERTGSYRAIVKVAVDGKVSAVELPNASPTLVTCTRDALMPVRFATAKTASTVTVVLTIK